MTPDNACAALAASVSPPVPEMLPLKAPIVLVIVSVWLPSTTLPKPLLLVPSRPPTVAPSVVPEMSKVATPPVEFGEKAT